MRVQKYCAMKEKEFEHQRSLGIASALRDLNHEVLSSQPEITEFAILRNALT